jgi:hypothetical protein
MTLNMMLWQFGFEPAAPANRCLVLGVGVVACIVLALLLNRCIWAPERMRPAHPSNLPPALRERKRTEITQQTGRSVNVAGVTRDECKVGGQYRLGHRPGLLYLLGYFVLFVGMVVPLGLLERSIARVGELGECNAQGLFAMAVLWV